MPRLATVEDAGVTDVFRQWRWPRALVVQFDGDQQRAVALLLGDTVFHAVQLRRCRIADTEALAGGHQAFAQLRVTGQVQIQAQRRLPCLPAPQAKQREQQARQNAVDQ
ncbi:hypothetical protein D9M73_249210 [compost metagenome]